MKKIGTILSGLTLIGAITILGACNQQEKTQAVKASPTAEGESISIAYVNSDTLLSKYELHQEFITKLEAKASDLQKELDRRSQAFQENITVLEQNAATMSQQQIQQTRAELQQLQQQLMQYRDERTQELAMEEQELNLAIKADMDTVLMKIQKREGYDFIFSYGPASELLLANPSYDITDIVVKELNEAYQKNKGSESETE